MLDLGQFNCTAVLPPHRRRHIRSCLRVKTVPSLLTATGRCPRVHQNSISKVASGLYLEVRSESRTLKKIQKKTQNLEGNKKKKSNMKGRSEDPCQVEAHYRKKPGFGKKIQLLRWKTLTKSESVVQSEKVSPSLLEAQVGLLVVEPWGFFQRYLNFVPSPPIVSLFSKQLRLNWLMFCVEQRIRRH